MNVIRNTGELVAQLERSVDKLFRNMQHNETEEAKKGVLALYTDVNILRQEPLGDLVELGLAQRAAAVVTKFFKVRDMLGMQHIPARKREVKTPPRGRHVRLARA